MQVQKNIHMESISIAFALEFLNLLLIKQHLNKLQVLAVESEKEHLQNHRFYLKAYERNIDDVSLPIQPWTDY